MKNLPPISRIIFALGIVLALILGWSSHTNAAPASCFGKPVTRTITGDNKTVTLNFKDVAWINGNNVTVTGKPYSRICAGDGRQIIYAGKGTSLTDAGAGNDKIVLHPQSNNNQAQGGPGNDELVGSKGHDTLHGSPATIPASSLDNDRINGNGGNDTIYDHGGDTNRLYGQVGSDKIHSLGTAISELHGGNGSDFLYSNGGRTQDGTLEKLFGEQGNDRLRADQPNNNGPAYLDGGEGDDRMYGTGQADTIIYNSGIKKVWGNAGDDLFVTSGRGRGTFEGGPGQDTISYAAHTPSERPGSISGVKVDLQAGTSLGYSGYKLNEIENVIGSAFDDDIKADPATTNTIQAGLGDDKVTGQTGDTIDGGLGTNTCLGGQQTNCNESSPGNAPGNLTQIDITDGGLLIVLGSNQADNIEVAYSSTPSRFTIASTGNALPSGLCQQDNSEISCPVDKNNLNGMLIYGDAGADTITLNPTIPATMTSTVNGGTGANTINGGPGKDFISTAPGSAGSILNGGNGLDVLYAVDKVTVNGGGDTDIFRVVNPCLGASLTGNAGTDSVVFAAAPKGIKASLAGRYAQWRTGPCANRTVIGPDIEKLEGSDENDWLIIGKRNPAQDGKSVAFGRGGIDILDARNGTRDTITTGAGGRKNKVIADPQDEIIWGYGLAGY